MAIYLIGDVQGCDAALQRLLEKLDFSPSRDTLFVLGDLVNRGPDSLAVLRRLKALGNAAQCLLGNHDLHLLAVAQGVRAAGRNDTLQAVLKAPDREALLNWLRQRPFALWEHGWLMVHAGVLPQWTLAQTLALAQGLQSHLNGPLGTAFLSHLYGNQPDHWIDEWEGHERWRVVVNALTRLRYCSADGVMDLETKAAPKSNKDRMRPWFELPTRLTQGAPIAFGHWSTLGQARRQEGLPLWIASAGVLALDTGCVWGAHLSAARLLPQAQGPAQLVEVVDVPG